MNLTQLLRQHRLVVALRGKDPEACFRTILTLVEQGIPLVEISLTSAEGAAVLARARQELGPDVPLGAGTIRTPADVGLAAEAGASYVVTPGLGDGVRAAIDAELPVLAGALTPTEVMAAAAAGASAVKLFPANLAGGPAYLRALTAPFPEIPLVPFGGVDPEVAAAYFAAGAVAVGVGTALLGDAPNGGDQEALRRRAKEFSVMCSPH
jgi:2-dehydro-3-deoxyphosphogluconate aldolase/(4S)-4-hydroxy-2-oxoglutarate aldolase